MQHRHLPALALVGLSLGCAADLDEELGDDGIHPPAEGMVGPDVSSMPRDGGGQLSTIDATDDVAWIYFDLEAGVQRQPDDPREDFRWDLAFKRFHIASNGGITGDAGVEVALVSEPFDSLSIVPTDGWVEDAPDGDDDNDDPEYAMKDWYDYNVMTHVLTPYDQTYVVRTGDGNAFKVAVQRYYDDAGSSGHVTIAWAPLSE